MLLNWCTKIDKFSCQYNCNFRMVQKYWHTRWMVEKLKVIISRLMECQITNPIEITASGWAADDDTTKPLGVVETEF